MKTLILNSDYLPLNIINARRAFVIEYKGHGEVISTYDNRTLRSPCEEYELPLILRLHRDVKSSFKFRRVPFSKVSVYKRDGFECQYCGSEENLTIDHIVPRSRNGKNNWKNVVTSCYECNNLKGDMLLKEIPEDMWGDRTKEVKAFKPHHLVMLRSINKVHDAWKKYLFFT